MKLTVADKELLKKWGYPEKDFEQIEMATEAKCTTYEMNGEKISATKAIEVLGREAYLSGIGRSAFHFTSFRENDNGQGVHFNSSKLFK